MPSLYVLQLLHIFLLTKKVNLHNYDYNYVVGMIHYFQDLSCIDITIAVSHVARYVYSLKHSYADLHYNKLVVT